MANYSMAFSKFNNEDNSNDYVNARYAPVGNQTVGIPFPAFKDYGGRFTQWQPSSLSMSTLKKQMNLPTDNTTFRQGLTQNAIGVGNKGLDNWVYGTQTLANQSLDTMFCTSQEDCSPFGRNFSCNSNYEQWDTAFGNQSGSVCSFTAYPEIDSGSYMRKGASEGGIGKTCTSDNECGSGYSCKNTSDPFGYSTQLGYCAMTFNNCPDGRLRHLQYGTNSGLPLSPPPNQNNGGTGYSSMKECKENAMPLQHCKQLGSSYFAVYPGYCNVPPLLRTDGNPQGAIASAPKSVANKGFAIPAYGTNMSSNWGSQGSDKFSALSAFNNKQNTMQGPFQYELSINPKPSNMQ
jgi:hypothetical protein